MKTYTLTFTIDPDRARNPAWENAFQLSVALKQMLEHRYGFEQIVDVAPAKEKNGPVRAFVVVKK